MQKKHYSKIHLENGKSIEEFAKVKDSTKQQFEELYTQEEEEYHFSNI